MTRYISVTDGWLGHPKMEILEVPHLLTVLLPAYTVYV
jgi:hypothetical protein